MSHPLAVAAIGFWHVHAGDYARAAQNHPGTTLVAIWDDDPERGRAAAQQFGVRSMPTVVLWRDGREVGRFVGARPRAFVAGMIERALAGDVAIASP